jgi:type IV secretory pathway VirJ component
MKRLLAVTLASIALAGQAAAVQVDSLRYGEFGLVRLYRETPRPTNVVIFISGDGGWNLGVVDMARALASLDAVVAGVDINHLIRALERSGEKCLYPAGDLELLSKAVQQYLHYPDYRTPVLVGYSSGATLVYAVLSQSPGETFKGAISLGFCPDLDLSREMCRGDGLDWRPGPKGKGFIFLPTKKLEVPWIALQGDIDKVCTPADTKRFVDQVPRGEIVMLPKVGHGFSVQRNWMPQFKAAFLTIVESAGEAPGGTAAAAQAPSAPPETARVGAAPGAPAQGAAVARPETTKASAPTVAGLPLVALPGTGSPTNALVILLSGDGGWGKTEQGISSDLAAKGTGVVGLNSLHYFWSQRTPEGTSKDIQRIARSYMALWHKTRLVLVGYSFGADVLPFAITRMPADLRAAVEGIVLISPDRDAEFQFHIGDWFGHGASTPYRTKPELEKLRGIRTYCFYGADDTDVLCTELDPPLATTVRLPGGHRVRGRYGPIVTAICGIVAGRSENATAEGGASPRH